MHLYGLPDYGANWAEEDCDLPVVMPFILHLLDRHSVQQEFGEKGTDPAYWRRRAEATCARYPDGYGAALPELQTLPPPETAE